MILIDVFDKFKHVVPIMGKEKRFCEWSALELAQPEKGNYC